MVFFALRLVVPYLEFRKKPVPTTIPTELTEVIDRLNNESTNDEDFLYKSYDYVVSKYYGNHHKSITMFWKAFQNPFKQKDGFMHCMGQNIILRTMLIKSGRFRDEDIELKITGISGFIHQYLLVSIGDCVMKVDPWSHFRGRRISQVK